MALQQLTFLLFAIAVGVDAAKILVMIQSASPSLFNLYVPIIEGLHAKKHDLTVQSLYPLRNPLPDVKVMLIKPSDFGGNEDLTKNMLLDMAKSSPIGAIYSISEMIGLMCQEYLTDETTKTLVAGGKQYDLVVVDGFIDCGVVVASLVGKHVIDVLGSGNFPWLYSDVPVPPSYIPNFMRRISGPMTFWQRLTNAVDGAAFRLINDYKIMPVTQQALDQHLPNAPTVEEAHELKALTLTNGDPILSSPRPSMPNVIECGGLHCTEAKPLPKELNDFIETSGKEGFIMLGLGTNMKSKFLPPETRDAILSAFSRLKQKVIWKFEAQLENCPKNVKITKWMPQQDLLGHPKCRLFITHSGLLSLQEAVYHGVPVIGMPFFGDQAGNIARIQELGIGEYLDFSNITADGLYELINKLLTDKSYRNNAKKYSAIFKDQPTKPADRAIYWIEYVLRHDGARHFRPASRDLNIFQYFLLDVIVFLLVVAIASIGVVVFVIKLAVRKLFEKKKRSDNAFEKKRK